MAISLKPFLDGTKISLEQEASSRFGSAVEDFSKGVIGPALGLNTAGLAREQIPFNRNDGSFYASSYAAHLAGATSYRPKLKFLFKVEFVFTEYAKNEFRDIFGGTDANDFTFMVKSVDRPKIDFEYQEDVNMYNFRTKVLKKIRHRELTITFMDDVGNRVLKFFRGLMMLHSPITRRQIQREGTTRPPDPLTLNTSNGMAFSTAANNPNKLDNASRGVVNANVGSIIKTVRVKQMYVDPGAKLGASTKEVIYDFINARIVSFDLDELTHETSDVSLMTMQFDYDWMEIVDVGVMTKMDGPEYKNIATPGVGGAPVDMTVYGKSADSGGGGLGGTITNILSNVTGRAAQSTVSTLVSNGISTIAGKGQFASLINSQASNILGGVVGAGARSLSSGLGNTINQGIARTFSSNVIDSAKGGPANIISSVKSTDGVLGTPQAGA